MMYREEVEAATATAVRKIAFLKENPLGYFVMAMMAGIYVGIGVLLAFTVGGLLNGASPSRLVMGATFAVALSLVVMAGSELFTGNNMVLAFGILKKQATVAQALRLWGFCWLGNAAGSILLALLYHLTGLGEGAVGEFMATAAATKMHLTPVALLTRGLLCNMLVCAAVWCTIRCKTESGKLIMIFWSILAFFTTGFEHSVANMTLLTVSLLRPAGQAVSLGGWFYNLVGVTIGNMIGGIVFLAFPYYLAQKEHKRF